MSRINMNKPLTQRLAVQITECVKAADEGFINLIKSKDNVGVRNAALVIKGGDTKVAEKITMLEQKVSNLYSISR